MAQANQLSGRRAPFRAPAVGPLADDVVRGDPDAVVSIARIQERLRSSPRYQRGVALARRRVVVLRAHRRRSSPRSLAPRILRARPRERRARATATSRRGPPRPDDPDGLAVLVARAAA